MIVDRNVANLAVVNKQAKFPSEKLTFYCPEIGKNSGT